MLEPQDQMREAMAVLSELGRFSEYRPLVLVEGQPEPVDVLAYEFSSPAFYTQLGDSAYVSVDLQESRIQVRCWLLSEDPKEFGIQEVREAVAEYHRVLRVARLLASRPGFRGLPEYYRPCDPAIGLVYRLVTRDRYALYKSRELVELVPTWVGIASASADLRVIDGYIQGPYHARTAVRPASAEEIDALD